MASGYEDRDNSAILFPNYAKKQPKHPDYRGTGKIGGKKYDLSAWEKQGTRSKFLSIAFSEPRGSEQQQPAQSAPAENVEQKPTEEKPIF